MPAKCQIAIFLPVCCNFMLRKTGTLRVNIALNSNYYNHINNNITKPYYNLDPHIFFILIRNNIPRLLR